MAAILKPQECCRMHGKSLSGVEGEGYLACSPSKSFEDELLDAKLFSYFRPRYLKDRCRCPASYSSSRESTILTILYSYIKLFAGSPGINEFTSTIVTTQHSCSVSGAEVKLPKLYGYQTINEKKRNIYDESMYV